MAVYRAASSVMHEMRAVASRTRVGRAALVVVWLGLAVMSTGITILQLTPALTRRELI